MSQHLFLRGLRGLRGSKYKTQSKGSDLTEFAATLLSLPKRFRFIVIQNK
jgi:hypothetical protein